MPQRGQRDKERNPALDLGTGRQAAGGFWCKDGYSSLKAMDKE